MRTLWVGLVLVTACGGGAGDDWKPAPGAPDLMSVIDVWAFSQTDVWFIDGSATVQRYVGDSWSTLDSGSGGRLLCIFALSPTEVWLCAGDDVLFYDGATFTAMDVSTPTGLDGITDVWASSQTDVWAVGDDAVVAHHDGMGWRRTIAGSPFKSSIWGSGPTDIYALSTFDLIHYDGLGWTEIDLDAGGGDGQVWGPAPDNLWAAGSAGAIAHYDGDSWTQVAHQRIGAPYLRQFFAVHGTSSTDVWAVGQQLGEGGFTALIYHYQP